MNHHRIALLTIICAGIADLACGLLYASAEHMPAGQALFCAAGNAVTEGSCGIPSTTAGHLIDLVEYLLVVPLVAAVFSLFTSALTGAHVRRAEDRIKQHVEKHGTHPPAPREDRR